MPLKDKEKRLEWNLKYQRDRYRERTDYILSIKKNSDGCVLCRYSKHKSILQFHHTDREVKSFSINGSRLANRSMKKINEEIDKCVLLCPNCHAEVHMNDGNHQGDKINRQGG